jgi:putative oxidoreductase
MATTTASLSEASNSHKVLQVALWIAQALLAVAFGMAGIMKTTTPIAELAAKMAWTGSLPEAVVRFIGVAELAGALGVILPAATRVRPALTPLAASGLVVIMVLAGLLHLSRGEAGALPINLVLGGLAAFVAWGRYRTVPIAPRF